MGHDKSQDVAVNMALTATAYLNLGTGAPPFSVVELINCNHLSFTACITGGTSPTGSFSFEVLDYGFAQDAYRNQNWAPLCQPYTQTAIALPVSANGNVNIQIPNLAAKYLRIKYNFTSGSGTLNASVTCRANSR